MAVGVEALRRQRHERASAVGRHGRLRLHALGQADERHDLTVEGLRGRHASRRRRARPPRRPSPSAPAPPGESGGPGARAATRATMRSARSAGGAASVAGRQGSPPGPRRARSPRPRGGCRPPPSTGRSADRCSTSAASSSGPTWATSQAARCSCHSAQAGWMLTIAPPLGLERAAQRAQAVVHAALHGAGRDAEVVRPPRRRAARASAPRPAPADGRRRAAASAASTCHVVSTRSMSSSAASATAVRGRRWRAGDAPAGREPGR